MNLFSSSKEAPCLEREVLTSDAKGAEKTEVQNPCESASHDAKLDLHVVILNNYLRKHHVAVYRELAKQVRQLTILLSVPMEPDRSWEAEWDGLDVQIQKNFMLTTWWKHSSGFSEQNFIHVPTDTLKRLRKLKPDVVLSYEMGMRTLLCSVYRRIVRNVPLVMVGNMSDHIEKERGFFRRTLRKIICSGVDYFTYNGPSCKRYLESLKIPQNRLFHFPYCIDEDSVCREEEVKRAIDLEDSNVRKLLYCGAISERKGIVQFTQALKQWCSENPNQQIELAIAGSGPLKDEVAKLQRPNLNIEFLGNCNAEELRGAYGRADIAVFPSLADEWGLVPVEAMASGLPVLGSIFAQSVESCCVESENGWIFDPTQNQSILDALGRAFSCSIQELGSMGDAAKSAVAHISPANSANHILEMVNQIRPKRRNTSYN
jgi:glycosyltransferase involved in cell wall biosynthesis